jgi:hypothetical protein
MPCRRLAAALLGGMIAAVLFIRLVRGRLRRTAGAFAYSVTAGLARRSGRRPRRPETAKPDVS